MSSQKLRTTAPFFSNVAAPSNSIASSATSTPSAIEFSIIAICHLSWDWVWQRPQQFLSRLASRHELLFVETSDEPVDHTEVQLRQVEGHPNVTRALMRVPAGRKH